MAKDLTYVCKYWNQSEPPMCVWWDRTTHICTANETLKDDVTAYPDKWPYCNYIGTFVSCSDYKAKVSGTDGSDATCILPDPMRHVCNRATGAKWVTVSGTTASGTTISGVADLDFSAINGYNDGKCNCGAEGANGGTDTTCSGYNPGQMSFGFLSPAEEGDTHIDTLAGGKHSSIHEFDKRLPIDYVMRNMMAIIGNCHWWQGSAGKFGIDSNTLEISLSGPTRCTLATASDFWENDNTVGGTGPACNGCKPSCPNYTGPCWEFCIDELMRNGDPILSEQIHELRYYCRESMWTVENLAKYYYDEGYIYAWKGTQSSSGIFGEMTCQYNALNGGINAYEIPANKTYMDGFEKFTVSTEEIIISEGTTVDGKTEAFPTLVHELKLIPLPPIILNKFHSGTSSDGDSTVISNFFQVNGLFDSELLIFGKCFYSTVLYEVFGFNVDDVAIRSVIPKEILEFDSMLAIQCSMGTAKFKEFYEKTEDIITAVSKTGFNKVFYNTLVSEKSESTFICRVMMNTPAESCTGTSSNTIVVFQATPLGLEYTKITFNRVFVGGILLQKEFSLIGTDEKTHTPFDYTKGFNAHINHNGTIKFDFVGIGGASFIPEAAYMYNDMQVLKKVATGSVAADPPVPPTMYRGFRLYKVFKENYILEEGSEYRAIGSDGYVLISLNCAFLNNVIVPWEVETVEITASDGVGSGCEMKVVHHGADGLIGPNQLIVKPVVMEKFRSICGGVTVLLKNICYYEKRSAGQLPEVDEDWNFEEVEDVAFTYNYNKDKSDIKNTGSEFTITDFQFIMVPTVVINDMAGRPFAQYKTKPLGWVRQPYCPDVEIYYSWKASYNTYINLPQCYCCGGHIGQARVKNTDDFLKPPCGDHDISSFSNTGPMWWPYDNCASIATYDLVTSLGYGSMDAIGLFKMDGLHGSHDMRMLGPEGTIAFTGDGCNFLYRCTCDWRTYTAYKQGESVFTGWARYRGGSAGQMSVWTYNGDALPKFGNVERVQMNSYRTIDKAQYERSSDGGETWTVDWELMPSFMAFNDVDFTKKSESVFEYGDSGEGSNVNHPLGMYIAEFMDGENVNEFIDYTKRVRFEDVFECRTTVGDYISYPKMKPEYSRIKDGKTLGHWYEFKAYPEGGTTYIQWAWRDVWWPLERNLSTFYTVFNTIYEAGDKYLIKGPYIPGINPTTNGPGGLSGKFEFLTIEYPDYVYDCHVMELRKVIYEGVHEIKFYAPEKDPQTGEYLGQFQIQLDLGPKRCINLIAGVWEDEIPPGSSQPDDDERENCNIDFYKECAGNPDFVPVPPDLPDGVMPAEPDSSVNDYWATDVTLFGTGYTSPSKEVAEADNRKSTTYSTPPDGADYDQVENNEYFQRGLTVTISGLSGNGSTVSGVSTSSLLFPIVLQEYDTYYGDPGIMYSCIDGSALTSSGTDVETNSLGIYTYCAGINPLNADITAGAGTKMLAVGRLELEFVFGSTTNSGFPSASGVEPTSSEYQYFHIPQITVYSAANDYGGSTGWVASTDCMELYSGPDDVIENKIVVMQWQNLPEYLVNGATCFILELRYVPTPEEIDALSIVNRERFDNSSNYVQYERVTVFDDVLTSAIEKIKTHERKFYISTSSSECPYQNGALNIVPNYRSTVYQTDTDGGVLGIENSGGDSFNMVSKVRGRLLRKTYPDSTSIGGQPADMELVQCRLYDEAIGDSLSTVYMKSIVPPGLLSALDRYNLTYVPMNCLTLKNNVLARIDDINSFPPMCGEGYTWVDGNYATSHCDGRGACAFSHGDTREETSVIFEYLYTPLDKNADYSLILSQIGTALGAMSYSASDRLGARVLTSKLLTEKGYYSKWNQTNEYGKIWKNTDDTSLIFSAVIPKGGVLEGSTFTFGVMSDFETYFWDFLKAQSDIGLGR